MVHTVRACSIISLSDSKDRVRTARSLLLRAVESLGNGSTPLEANSENANPRLQLANRDASALHAHQMHHDWQAVVEGPHSPSWLRVVWIHCPNSPPHVKKGGHSSPIYRIYIFTICTVLARCS